MDWLNLIWNVRQEQAIQATELAADGARQAALNTYQEIARLEQKIDRLSLISQAMWTLLKERTDFQEKDLIERITKLDMEDGKLDGRRTKPPEKCPKCDAYICNHFGRCLFCGYTPPTKDAFQAT